MDSSIATVNGSSLTIIGVAGAVNDARDGAHGGRHAELCEGRPYNVKSDVWAYGCILFEMCSGGAPPFVASNQVQINPENPRS
eukprot:58893-Rhodomonas_salina.1